MSDLPQIILDHIKVLKVEDGDTLVLTFPHRITADYHVRLQASFQDAFPDYKKRGLKLLVLSDDTKLEVLRNNPT